MENQKAMVENFFSANDYWQGRVYVPAEDDLFARAVVRRKSYVMDMIRQLPLKPGAKILDIGCGCGAYFKELIAMNFHITGMDSSEEMMRRCEHGFDSEISGKHVTIMRGDVEKIPFENHTFDLVLCIGVLGYLLTDYEALREIRRVTKPEGFVVLAVDNMWNLTDCDYLLRRKLLSIILHREEMIKPTQPGTIPSEWILNNPCQRYYYKKYDLKKFEGVMEKSGFHGIDAITFHFPFRCLRRLQILPSNLLDWVELKLEGWLRSWKIPLIWRTGIVYTAVFQKIGFYLIFLNALVEDYLPDICLAQVL